MKIRIFHNSKHLRYLNRYFTFEYVSESFYLHVIFQSSIASSVDKYVQWIQTQFVLNDTIYVALI
jgi:hypothetical protein